MSVSRTTVSMIATVFIVMPTLATVAHADGVTDDRGQEHFVDKHRKNGKNHVQLGPRPFYLVEKMETGKLKTALQQCSDGPFYKTDFSIGHRGAALQFPEHTKESYQAAARMGAGILECDVTFTEDLALVCRHSQCDLHTTTNILATPLAAQCSVPFSPAEFDADTGALTKAASAQCCTSDITLDEFKTLCGKMDASNPNATTAAEFLGGTPSFRTDLYATCGTLLTHAESIELFKDLNTKMTPELKAPGVPMPFNGFSQDDYRQKLIDEYKAATSIRARYTPSPSTSMTYATGLSTRHASASRRSTSTTATRPFPVSIRAFPRPGYLAWKRLSPITCRSSRRPCGCS